LVLQEVIQKIRESATILKAHKDRYKELQTAYLEELAGNKVLDTSPNLGFDSMENIKLE